MSEPLALTGFGEKKAPWQAPPAAARAHPANSTPHRRPCRTVAPPSTLPPRIRRKKSPRKRSGDPPDPPRMQSWATGSALHPAADNIECRGPGGPRAFFFRRTRNRGFVNLPVAATGCAGEQAPPRVATAGRMSLGGPGGGLFFRRTRNHRFVHLPVAATGGARGQAPPRVAGALAPDSSSCPTDPGGGCAPARSVVKL